MNIPFIEQPKVLLDAALSRGRKGAAGYAQQKTHFYTVKGKELTKIDISGEYLEEKLFKAVSKFPSFDTLEPFYKDLYECIIDINELRKNLSSITSVARIIKNQRREGLVKLKELKYVHGNEKKAFEITKAYVGRIASLLKGLKEPIAYFNESARKLNELPSIKTNEECIIIAGFPNVGKSTLLSKITESKPEIAAYPFTTKGLNVGVFHRRFMPIQVIDTPGLLDRPLHERNKIELKAVTAFQYLEGTILFAVDPLDDMIKQKGLFDELKKLFSKHKFMIVVTKTDISPADKVEEVQKVFDSYEIILEGNGLNNLKERLMIREKKVSVSPAEN
ncbi:GTPase Obg [uncultured archaeon]|nr:GTPase Obg [uncultured archaeon]